MKIGRFEKKDFDLWKMQVKEFVLEEFTLIHVKWEAKVHEVSQLGFGGYTGIGCYSADIGS